MISLNCSWRAMSVACSPAAPPNANSAKRRGATPRRTEASRTPPALLGLPLRCGPWPAATERDAGGGAAWVEGGGVVRAEAPGGGGVASHAAGGPGHHPPRREPPGLGDRRDPAMRLDDQRRSSVAGFGEPRLEPREI